MSLILETYLDRVLIYANLPAAEAADVRAELGDHLLKKVETLQQEGLSHEDAAYRAVQDHGHPRVVGYGLRKGFRLIDIRSSGTARGVIAIGPRAVGVVAFGGMAFGVFACGGLAAGVFCMGGIAAALLFAFGGVGIGLIAYGGLAIGFVAVGGLAIGVVAHGGLAVGLLARGAQAFSAYNPQTAPAPGRLQTLSNLLQNRRLYVILQIALVPLLFLLIIVSNVLIQRERRRVQQADPWLQE